jgi:hypothetical protein
MTHHWPRLDRRVEFDERSRAFPFAALTPPRSYTWRCDSWLDQGREGACVGFAWAHEANARPVVVPASTADALDLYRRAQRLDPWEGEAYDGTSVLAGAKAMTDRGWLSEYRWAFSPVDALSAISRHGPCVLGVWWWDGMWDTDEFGFIEPRGTKVGGHAILATGVNVTRRTVTLHNSWGPAWGVNGKALITWDAFDSLLNDDGECCVPVRRTAA